MNKTNAVRALLLLTFACSLSFSKAKAQACDPWIVDIYTVVFNRVPTADECKITHYNNGHWNSYAQLVSLIVNYQGFIQGDPWIIQAYWELYNRVPLVQELNVHNYNNGNWGSYADLKGYIAAYQNSMNGAGASVHQALNSQGNIISVIVVNGQQKAIDVISRNAGQILISGSANIIGAGAGNIIGAGAGNIVGAGAGNIVRTGAGGNIVGAGAGNIVGAGAGNIIGAGAGNIIGAGAGNILNPTKTSFTINPNIGAGFRFGSNYGVQSVGAKVIPTSGKGAIIIQ